MRKYLLAVGVAAAAVVALLLYLTGGGGLERVTSERVAGGGPAGSRRVTYLLQLEVEGGGRLLVNGSQVESLALNRTFTAVVEAVPEACYALKLLLVNGTPVEGSRLELRIGGNTTVRAVFERPLHRIWIHANVNASALVNGTLYSLPAELSVRRCEVLNITPVAPRGYAPSNGSVALRVERDESLFLAFEKVAALVKLSSILAPVRVNGTLYESDALLEAPLNVTLLITPVTDQKGCTEYNETHLVCVVGWRVKLIGWTLNNLTGFDYPSRVIPMPVNGDAELIQLHAFTKRNFPVKWAEILTPEGPVKVKMVPMDRWFIFPFIGDYEYIGDGWIKLEGKDVGIYLEMPEGWGKVRIYVKHVKPAPDAESYVELVVRNTVDFLSIGFFVPPCCGQVGEGEAVFVIDSGALEAFKEPGYDPMPLGEAWDPRLKEYFIKESYSCSPNVPKYYCVAGLTQAGPGSRVRDGIKEGWLRIEISGILYVKVEIIEWRR